MEQFVRNVRGIPLWLLREYLLELGGQLQPDGTLLGNGWQGRLTQLEDYRIGSLRVGEVRLELLGDGTALAALFPALERRLLRAGG